MMYIYHRLKDLREDADKTQTEVAEILPMKQQQYARYESGVQEIPLHHYYYACQVLSGIAGLPRGGRRRFEKIMNMSHLILGWFSFSKKRTLSTAKRG